MKKYKMEITIAGTNGATRHVRSEAMHKHEAIEAFEQACNTLTTKHKRLYKTYQIDAMAIYEADTHRTVGEVFVWNNEETGFCTVQVKK